MSGGETFVINVRMVGEGQVEAGAGKVAAANREMAASAQSASAASAKSADIVGKKWTTAGASMVKVGHKLNTHVTLPLVALGVAAGKMSLDFNRSMLSVSTQAGGSTREVKRLGDQILTLSANGRFAQGPQELSEALFHIESTGYRGAKAMKVLKAASDLAVVGNADLESTTNALVGAMKTGITGAGDMREAIGLLNASIGAGNLKMEDLNGAIGTGFLSRAKAVGLTLQDAGAALGELTSQAVPANSAATRLSMTFSLLANPTTKAQGVLKSIGLDSEALAKKFRGPDGLVSALELLQEHMKGMTKIEQSQALSEAFGGAKSGGTIIALLNNVDDLNKKYKEIGENAGNFNEKLKETNAEESVKLEKAWSGIRASLIKVGNELLPMVGPLLRGIGEDVVSVVHAFTSLPDGTKEWIVKIGLVAAALGPVMSLGGNLLKFFGGAAKATQTMAKWLGIIETEQLAVGAGGALTTVEAGAAGAGAGAAGSKLLGPGGTSIYEELGLAGSGAAAGGAARGGLRAGVKGAAQGLARTVLGAAGGYVVAELGVHGLKALGVGDPTEGQGILGSLTHGFDTSKKPGVTSEEEGNKIVAGLNPKRSTDELRKLKRSFHMTMLDIHASAAYGMGEISKELGAGLKVANATWIKGSRPWRAHTARAMRAAVHEIEQGMAYGEVSTKQGQKRINELLRQIHLVKGDDPFGLAQATVKSFKQAGQITETGVKQWVANLEQLPKGAREKSIDATQKMLAAWADGHPKLEHAITAITQMQLRKFGATNKQLREGVKQGATGPVAEAYDELAHGVGGALENIGTNANRMLQAVGAKDMVQFKAIVLTSGGPKFSSRQETKAAFKHEHRARGGVIGGSGLRDTVPVMAAPGEAFLTRHDQPEVQAGLAAGKALGVTRHGSLQEMFSGPRRPHYMPMAHGGEVRVSGPRSLANIGGATLEGDVKAVNAFIRKHMPSGVVPSGKGLMTIDGHPVAAWIGKILLAARHAGIAFNVSSGYRTDAEQTAIYESGVRPAAVPKSLGGPGSRHEGIKYPLGAVDISPGAESLAAWLGHSRYSKTLIYAGSKDPVHFSHPTGGGYARGGFVQRFAQGGRVVKGKVSYFGGGSTAGGKNTSDPGIALNLNPGTESGWNNATTQGWMTQSKAGHPVYAAVTITGHKANLPIIDLGPAASTGRAIDVTEGGVGKLGLSTSSFPTDSVGTAVVGASSGTSASSEKVPGVFNGAHTHGLSFPPIPKSLPAVEREVDRWQREARKYRRAAKAAAHKPATQHAIEANVSAIEKHLRELWHKRSELRREKARKKVTRKLSHRLGKITGVEGRMEAAERAYEEANQFAEQTVDLEPQSPILPAKATEAERASAEQAYVGDFTKYVEGQERPAYEGVLGHLATWRNLSLEGEGTAARLETGWEGDIRKIGNEIDQVKKLQGSHTPKWWNEHPDAQKKMKAEVAKLPMLRFRERELRKVLGEAREAFFPGRKNPVEPPNAPAAGTGSLEDTLVNIQGVHWPDQHSPIKPLPGRRRAGFFGGAIWDAQTTIEELGVKVAEAAANVAVGEGGEDEKTSAMNELLKQRNEELEREAAVHRAQEPVLADYLGAYEKGGILPRTGFYLGHEGEEVIPKDQRSGTSSVHVLEPHIHVSDELAPYISATIERRYQQAGRTVGLGLGTPSAPGRRAAMGRRK